ncbi:MAG: DUF4340 domain-containing protein [Gammaproteobacteria bacterium]|nr:DUF4340 domain-containing protein [Gammaproteobacteria bacterium]
MNKWISILSGLLIAQLVLAVTVNLTGEDYGAFQAEEKLLTFQAEQVDGLRIEGDEQSVLLKRQDDRWLLPEQGDFPADQESVKRLLDKLDGLEKGWPVATTSGAASRFEVAEDEFQRKLALLGGDDTLAELYVGTSPGFRKVHVRPANDEAVYAVEFNTWEANAKADDWIDKAILELDKEMIERIEMSDLVFEREGDWLTLTGLTDGQEADKDAIDELVDKLATLRVQSLLGTETKPEYQQDAPELEIELALNGGDALSYRISKPEGESYYVLKRSDLDYWFKVPDYTVEPIMETTRDKLVLKTTEEATSELDSETVSPSPVLSVE